MDAKTLCLGALIHGSASGYEIRKLFEDGPFSAIHDVSFGSIYPALTVLLERGWATCSITEQDGRPDKKVYSITPEGRTAFLEALTTTPAPDKMRSEILFILAFGDFLPQADVLSLVDRYIADYEERLAAALQCAEQGEAPLVRRFVHQFGVTMYKTAIQFLRDHQNDLLEQDPDMQTAANESHRPLAALGGQP